MVFALSLYVLSSVLFKFFLTGRNDAQRRAIEHQEVPLLVVEGAGCGSAGAAGGWAFCG